MATFKNFKTSATDAGAVAYTAPAGGAVVLYLAVESLETHVTGAPLEEWRSTVWWTDDSDSDAISYITRATIVSHGMHIPLLQGKLVLEVGDTIVANVKKLDGSTGTSSKLGVWGSVMEII